MQPALDRIRQNSTLSADVEPPNVESIAAEPVDELEEEVETAETLHPEQIEALASLAAGISISKTAERVGVHRSTIHNWLNHDDFFAAEYNRMKRERLEGLRNSVHQISAEALATLRELLTNAEVPPAIRLRAALSILDGLGAFDAEIIGPTDPEQVGRQRYMGNLHQEFPQLL